MKHFIADGVKLPAKTTVQVQTFALHRNAKVFEEPEQFDPNRFLKISLAEHESDSEMSDLNGDHHPFAYIPFGKNDLCTGMTHFKIIVFFSRK